MPVNSLISPRRAFAYIPFTSRCSQTDNGVSTKTSMNWSSSIMARTASRVSRYGETAAHITVPPWRTISLATKPIRRMFVSRSSLEKPSPFERWVRTTSPSSSVTCLPASRRRTDRTAAVVDLPEPLRPVSQMQSPWRCRGG